MDVLYIFSFTLLLSQGYASTACRFPGAPAHSKVSFSTEDMSEGTTATYACERGFELLGPARRVCGPDGKWTPDGIPFCVINVAAGKAPMQASTEEGGVPQRALDGSTAATFSADTCTLTKTERVPWWYVNLLEPYMVQLVRLDFGKPCCGTNKPAVIVVRVGNNRPDLGTNPICNRFTGFLEEGQPLFLPCNPPMPGAFVSVHQEAAEPSQLSICEAFVYTDQALPIERCPQFRDQPPGSTATYNGKCYIFYNGQPSKFKDALGFCRSRGGTLVDESNPALQGFISWELWRRHRSDSSSQYWMGAVRDPRDPSNWKWINGKDVTVSFWNAPGGSHGCARFDGSKGWLWADTDCQARLNYICQHQPKACGRPEQPPNSTMLAESYEVGRAVQYECDEGHLLVGPTVRTCLDTGFYDEFPPVCKRIVCGNPASIAHGSYALVNESVSYLAQVQYACDAGHEMVGRGRLVCDFDERWNGPPPRCDVVQCEAPPQIRHGQVSLSTNTTATFGAVAEYACDVGFRLRGKRRISCLHDGTWDYPAPLCHQLPSSTSAPSTYAPSSSEPSVTERSTTAEPPSVTPPSSPVVPGASPTRPYPWSTSRRPVRPSSPTPFLANEPTRRPRPTTTEPTTTSRRTSTEILRAPRPTTTERLTTRPKDRQDTFHSPTSHQPQIIIAGHPRESQQAAGAGNNIRAELPPRVNVPQSVDGDRREGKGVRHLAMVIALGVFGALVFIVAVITSMLMLLKRKRVGGSRYRQHVSPDSHTVASVASSSSESRSGLNRFYRAAWDELHESAGAGLRRARDPPKDAELAGAGAGADQPPKRRHHHHHRDHRRDHRRHDHWRSPQPPHRPHHAH